MSPSGRPQYEDHQMSVIDSSRSGVPWRTVTKGAVMAPCRSVTVSVSVPYGAFDVTRMKLGVECDPPGLQRR